MLLAAAALCAAAACARPAPVARERAIPLFGTPGGGTTEREDLDRTINAMNARLAAKPDDAAAAVTLADALLRQTRVKGNAGFAMRAEAALQHVLASDPQHFQARRMLAAVYLSQHRFRDALRAAEQCQQARPDDAWLFGVIGDAHLELGEYDQAFAAFDQMLAHRPDAAGYGRASYARELQGDLAGALKLMQMALDATSPRDPESLAWHHAQLGHLYFGTGRIAQARREFEHADFVFPGHPFAQDGLARVADAEGDSARALTIVNSLIDTAPTPAALAFAGDLLSKLGRRDEAERKYELAEAAWRSDAPEPAKLAVFLADRGRKLDDAVRLAEGASAARDDIFTNDALAWAYFKGGQIDRARAAIARAQRTGTRDRGILAHAAAIARGSDPFSTDPARLVPEVGRPLAPKGPDLWKTGQTPSSSVTRR
jgi:tetratricopeptide (TPR) repeat protein